MVTDCIALILAGGSGKRLWPLSNEEHPKQLSSEIFDGTLLNEAVKRAKKIVPEENIYILTLESLKEDIEKVCGVKNILVQPMNADTASAFCMAAIYFNELFPDKPILSLYSDHVIPKDSDFEEAVKISVDRASQNEELVCLGSIPNYADPNFGYIEKGELIEGKIFKVSKYVEKPIKQRAEEFVRKRTHLWNTGYFCFKPQTLIDLFSRTAPEFLGKMMEISHEILENKVTDESRDLYNELDQESFEHLILERSKDLVVIETKMQWNDIGSWDALYNISQKDDNFNAVIDSEEGVAIVSDSTNSIVYPGNTQMIVIGIDNLVIASVDNKVLVCKRSNIDKIKKLVKKVEKLSK